MIFIFILYRPPINTIFPSTHTGPEVLPAIQVQIHDKIALAVSFPMDAVRYQSC